MTSPRTVSRLIFALAIPAFFVSPLTVAETENARNSQHEALNFRTSTASKSSSGGYSRYDRKKRGGHGNGHHGGGHHGGGHHGGGHGGKAPNCDAAFASPGKLWPPNNRYSKVRIDGVGGRGTYVAVQCITQDEPLKANRKGRKQYTAKGIGGSSAYVRKQRLGSENGRVYHIDYKAWNRHGQCTGTVTVGVPKNRWSKAIDDGRLVSAAKNNRKCSISPVNQPPSISSTPLLNATAGVEYSYQATATDPDGDQLTYSVSQLPAGANINSQTGLLSWTPGSGQLGDHNIALEVSDGQGGSDSQSFTLTVERSNSAPLATPQQLTVNEDGSLAITLTGSDSDGDTLSFSVGSNPSAGVLSGEAPALVYTPALNFNGSDSFTFSVSDGELSSVPALVSIQVNSVNDAPTANAQALTLNEDSTLDITLSGSDPDGDSLSYTLLTPPGLGTISGTAPNIRYTANDNINGDDNFTFVVSDGTVDSTEATISLSILAVNDSPVAKDIQLETSAGTPVDVTLDSTDPDQDTLSYAVVTDPQNGVLSGAGQALSYTPNAGFSGTDSFTYRSNDGELNSNTATVQISVVSNNAAPVIGSTPVTQATQDSLYTYQVNASDDDGDPISFALQTAPSGMSVDATSGEISWLPTSSDATNVLASNAQCKIPGSEQEVFPEAMDAVMVVDGSLSNYMAWPWMSSALAGLDADLQLLGIGANASSNRYGLMYFGSTTSATEFESGLFGAVDELYEATFDAVPPGVGGRENGLLALQRTIDSYPFREDLPKNLIWIPDEPQQNNLENGETLAEFRQRLINGKFNVHVVTSFDFECDNDSRLILGLTAEGQAFVEDGRGGFETCEFDTSKLDDVSDTDAAFFLEPFVRTALASGGGAWSLRKLTQPPTADGPDILREALTTQLFGATVSVVAENQQSDLTVAGISVVQSAPEEHTAQVSIINRGLVASETSSAVNISSAANPETVLGSAIVPVIQPGETVQLAVLVSTASPPAVIRAAITPVLNECDTANNGANTPFVTIVASDPNGGEDTQSFSISVNNVNDAPQITSNPDNTAQVGRTFSYTPQVQDADIGDAHSYRVTGSGIASIDSISGVFTVQPKQSDVGTHNFAITVTDLAGESDTQSFALTIVGNYITPFFDDHPRSNRAIIDQLFQSTPSVTADPTAVLSFSLLESPSGMSIDELTGTVSWTPSPDDFDRIHLVTIVLSDQFNNRDALSFMVFGDTVNTPPSIVDEPDTLATLGDAFQTELEIADDNVREDYTVSLNTTTNVTIDNAQLNGLDTTSILLNWGRFNVDGSFPQHMRQTDHLCQHPASTLPNAAVQFRPLWDEQRLFIGDFVLAAPLADSNGDGQINTLDRNSVLISYPSGDTRILEALDGISGQSLWVHGFERSSGIPPSRRHAPAIADINGDGVPDIIQLAEDNTTLFAMSTDDGRELWRTSEPVSTGFNTYGYGQVTLTDIEGDGQPEILVAYAVFDANGNLLMRLPEPTDGAGSSVGSPIYPVDLDMDGERELVQAGVVRSINNSEIWRVTFPDGHSSRLAFSAFANFDSDPEPEMILVERSAADQAASVSLVDNGGALLWGPVAISVVGQPVVADFDSDGQLEIFVAGDETLFDHLGNVQWSLNSQGNSDGETALAADIQNNGRVELILHRDGRTSIIDGLTGAVIVDALIGAAESSHIPVLVDITGDGSPELISTDSRSVQVATYIGSVVNPSLPNLVNQRWWQANTLTSDLQVNPVVSTPWVDNNADQSLTVATRLFDQGISDIRVGAPQGSRSQISVELYNRGTAATNTTVDVTIYAGNPDAGGTELATQAIGSLDISETRILTFPVTVPEDFVGEIVARAVPRTAITECQTNNNSTSAHLLDVVVEDYAGAAFVKDFLLGVQYEIDTFSLSSPTPTTATEGEEFSLQIEFNRSVTSKDDNNTAFYSFTAAPDGASIDPLTGLLTWTPDYGQAGTHSIAVIAYHLDGASQRFLSVTVQPSANTPPEITSTPVTGSRPLEPFVYDVQATDADGDTLSYSLPTAPSGMTINSSTGLIQWTPDAEGVFSVVVSVDDGIFSTTQAFTLTIVLANEGPEITSTPSTSVDAGVTYQYQVEATDPEGEDISYSLTTAPLGMSINDTTGLISWATDLADAGVHPIEVRATDASEQFSTQSYQLTVVDATPNQPPQITSSAPVIAVTGQEYQYSVMASDPDGDSLTYQLTAAPAGMTVSPTGLISWQADVTQLGLNNASLRVEDGRGGFATQNFVVEVLEGGLLALNLGITPAIAVQGNPVTITTTPINAVAPFTVELLVNGNAVTLDSNFQAQVVENSLGEHSVQATLTDPTGTAMQTGSFTVREQNNSAPPVVSVLQPMLGDEVTAATDVIISVTDDGDLSNWRLVTFERGSAPSEFLVLAEGTDTGENMTAASFDPSLLFNGQHVIVLQAFDTAGNESQDNVVVSVDGDLKVGNFSFTIEDVNVPLAGIPIAVSRTYDTRQKHRSMDFGHGWSVDYQNVRVHESRTPGAFWQLNQYMTGPLGTLLRYCVEPQGAPLVTVTLPNGDVERFEIAADPVCNDIVPILDVTLEFTPLGDTQSTLEALNDNTARLVNGALVEDGSFSQPVNPSRYLLTTRAGYQYYLHQAFGVEQIIDPNGHTITYSDSGIVHSSGKAVSFTRDSDGRITAVTDPSGNSISYSYDSNNDLQSVRERDSAESTYVYNTEHGLVDMFDPLGRRLVRNIYDDDGRLIAQEDENGVRTDFSHDLSGRQSIITDRNGNTTIFDYDERGNVTSQTDALSNTRTYTFDARDNQLSETDPLGNESTATYNSNNDQLTQVDALGNELQFSYNARGQETQITDARGNVYQNTYDSVGNLLSVTDPLSNVAGNNINAQGLVASTTDAVGNTTSYTYDSEGNKLTELDAQGNTRSYTYDANNNVLTETVNRSVFGVPVGETTTFTYDSRNRVISTIDPLGNLTRSEYNLADQETAQIDALGRRTEMDYDVYGNLLEVRYPDGTSTQHVYDAENNRTSTTDRLGRTTSFGFDALNRLVSTAFPDGSTTRSEYDAAGRLITEIDGNGNRTNYRYDEAGRRVEVEDALGNVHTLIYDGDGNVTGEIDANGVFMFYTLNGLDQRVSTVYQTGDQVFENFDALGRRTEHIDEAGIQTQFGYDELGRLSRVTDALGNTSEYEYDELGNKLVETTADFNRTSWEYDALGRATRRTLPGGQVETMVYDAVGNLTSHTDFNGDTTTHQYDVNNRLIQSDFADGSQETFAYDAEGNRTAATYTVGGTARSWSYGYDGLNRLTSETQPDGTNLTYTYDGAGNKTSLTVTQGASAQITRYGYDALNRLATVTDPNGNVSSYSYDAVGNRTLMAYHNGNRTNYVYDGRNRLTRLSTTDSSSEVLQQFDYTLHPTGRRTQIDEANGRSTSYGYDVLYRLTSESISDAVNGDYTASYSYDAVGNRTQSVIDGVTTAYSYDENNRLTQQGGTVYSYDSQGNTLSETLDGNTVSYSYNSQHELIERTDASGSTLFEYNADGIRTAKSEGGTTTAFTIDSNRDYAQVIRQSDGASSREYVYGDDLISQTLDGVESVYHYDGLGSTRSLSDAAGNLTDSYNYEAFGTLLNQTGSTDNSYLFTGEQFDGTLGQYYLRARYYDQGVGRFTQMDTWMGIGIEPITLNKNLYAESDPVNNVDPLGLFTLHDFTAAQNTQAVNATLNLAGAAVIFSSSLDSMSSGASQNSTASGIRCLSAVVESTMGMRAPKNANEERECGDLNQMRAQWQQGTSPIDVSVVLTNFPNRGVSVRQVQAGLNQIYLRRSEPNWWPSASSGLDRWMYDSIISLSKTLNGFPPHGVPEFTTGTILTKQTTYRSKNFRIDIENIRGNNLKRLH